MIAAVPCWPITSVLMGERATDTAEIAFQCSCGVDELLTICDASIHPPLRFTAALRARHAAGAWPNPTADPGDAVAAGWPAPSTPESETE